MLHAPADAGKVLPYDIVLHPILDKPALPKVRLFLSQKLSTFALFMKKAIFVISICLCILQGNAQADSIARSFSTTITTDDLQEYLSFIAGDNTEGRETGTPGLQRAAQYISAKFSLFGVEIPSGQKSYYQNYPYQRNISKDIALYDSTRRYEFLKDFYVQPEIRNTLLYNKKVVFLGYGIGEGFYNDYKQDTNLTDKIVILLNDEPVRKGKYVISKSAEHSDWYHNMSRKLELVKRYKPAAVVVIDDQFRENITKFKTLLTKHHAPILLESVQQVETPVLFTGMGTAAALLKLDSALLVKMIQRGASKRKPFHYFSSNTASLEIDRIEWMNNADNVIGFVEGTDLKDEVIVISAHYDHLGKHKGKVYYGADDDGSGTVAMLELAQAFGIAKRAGHGPRRSIVFCAFSGEEKGLMGSAFYSKLPWFPMEKTVLDLNIDMIGRVDSAHAGNPLYIYPIGTSMLSSELKPLLEKNNDTYSHLVLDYKYDNTKDPNRFYYRSDHYNFAKHNVPVIFFFNGTHADYHKSTDTIEKIQFPKMQSITRLIFFTAWDAANRTERIKTDLK